MTELALIYQTEPGRATPRLKPLNGAVIPWTDDELRELEADLARQYPDLIRGKVDTLTFRERPLRVTVKHDGGGRMPAVVLTDGAGRAEGPWSESPAWLDGLLAEVERLGAEAGPPGLDALERAMLKYAADELRALAGRVGAGGVAGLLMAGHLGAAEHLARPADPDRATVYAVALRGLDKLLARVGADEAVGRAGRGSGDGPIPRAGAVARLMRRLLGLSGGPGPSAG